MNDGGYTLVEMLAAVSILGLAFGGLAESASIMGRLQRHATLEAQAAAHESVLQNSLSLLLRGAGPFPGNGSFVGQPAAFEFTRDGSACRAAIDAKGAAAELKMTCAALTSTTAVPASAAFRYADTDDVGPDWPTAGKPDLLLKSVSLIDTRNGDRPLATTLISVDEPATCLFDVVAQQCRGAP